MTLAASATLRNSRSSFATTTMALLCCGEELAACGTAGEWLATAATEILEDLGQGCPQVCGRLSRASLRDSSENKEASHARPTVATIRSHTMSQTQSETHDRMMLKT